MYNSNTLPGLTIRLHSLANSDKIIIGLRVKRIVIDSVPVWTATWNERTVK